MHYLLINIAFFMNQCLLIEKLLITKNMAKMHPKIIRVKSLIFNKELNFKSFISHGRITTF